MTWIGKFTLIFNAINDSCEHFLFSLLENIYCGKMEKKFKIVVEKGLDGYFIGEVLGLPGCYSQGKTLEELTKNIKEAIELYIETLSDLNKKPETNFVTIKEVVINA